MIIYPKGNKSLLMAYEFRDSVLFNTTILNVEENSQQTTLVLRKLDNNVHINPLWFQIDSSTSTSVPGNIRQGTFISSDGTLLRRTASVQTEKSQNGKLEYTLFITWFNNYTYTMVHSTSTSKTRPFETGGSIVVKIVAWNRDEYVCHYFSNGVSGTQEYKVKN